MGDAPTTVTEVGQPPRAGDDEKGVTGSELEAIDERLKSSLGQLHSECAILERIVHKNKNQHRRSGYFQYLLKVRRDCRLLKSARLEELVNSCFLVINGNKPHHKILLLESLKRRKCESGKRNFMERLLGAARLLSQAVEPMLKAATEISIMLARSFFMGFSLTTLALLARLRVLAQQILLDVISVFNVVSSLSQKRQSLKLSEEGVEIFREYYPRNQHYITLDCVWETDKFVLVERMHKSGIESKDLDQTDSLATVQVRYESIEALLEGAKSILGILRQGMMFLYIKSESWYLTSTADEEEPDLIPEVAEMNRVADAHLTQIREDKTESNTNSSADDKPSEDFQEVEDATATSITTSDPKTESKRVAFVSIKRPSPSQPSNVDLYLKKARREDAGKEDPFFNLLASGNLRDSLF